jgi:hypothetical protein
MEMIMLASSSYLLDALTFSPWLSFINFLLFCKNKNYSTCSKFFTDSILQHVIVGKEPVINPYESTILKLKVNKTSRTLVEEF